MIARDQVVVSRTSAGREESLVVQLRTPIADPRWRVDDLHLEDIVLAYLGRRAPAARLAAVER